LRFQRTDDVSPQAAAAPFATKIRGYVVRALARGMQRVHASDVLIDVLGDNLRDELDQAEVGVTAALVETSSS
jgi:hypothetical protein